MITISPPFMTNLQAQYHNYSSCYPPQLKHSACCQHWALEMVAHRLGLEMAAHHLALEMAAHRLGLDMAAHRLGLDMAAYRLGLEMAAHS